MMRRVVEEGTGTAAALSGLEVAGKTGTAETGNANLNDAWFIGFAPASDPEVAVAVVVENTPGRGRRGGRADRRPGHEGGHRGGRVSGLEPGGVIGGRYEIGRQLGAGGMARVYLAHDRLLDREVAIKVLADRYAADPAFVERFRREASAAAGLNHPNIVSVYDRGEADGSYYIVMEYLDGPDLKQVLRRRGQPAARRGGRRRAADPGRAARRPPPRRHPPRHQAAERDGRRGRAAQGHGLRHRPRRGGQRRDRGRLDHRARPSTCRPSRRGARR